MEKGYNLQERPASEEEGGPLLIRLVGHQCTPQCTINVLLYSSQRTSKNMRNIFIYFGTSCIESKINLYSQIVMDGFSKGEHQPEKHSGRQREGTASQHGDNVEALLEGEAF